MKCPIPVFYRSQPSGLAEYEIRDCIKGECAWWLDDIQMCAIRDLALEARYTQLRVQEIDHRLDRLTLLTEGK